METISYKIGSKEYVFEQITNDTNQYKIVLSAKHNNKILWKNVFENIHTKEIKGLYKIKNELFCFMNNFINKIDIYNGNIIKTSCFGNTPIEKIIVERYYMYILFDYYEFDNKKYVSNILCINNNFDIKWRAELFDKDDAYTFFKIIEKNIIGYTWNGWTCNINKNTGKLIDKKWTK
jgi:hypothetical protein